MVKVDPAESAGIYRRMADGGVLIRHRGDQVHCEGCLRITVCTQQDNELALKTLAAELEKLQSGEPSAKRTPQ